MNPSLIVKLEFHAGMKGDIFRHRVWKASNLALWALSPPQTRCFIVNITNYDYVPTPVKRITISTGDEREKMSLEGKNGAPLYHIPVGQNHQWAFDALPIFMDIASALYDDQNKEKAGTQKGAQKEEQKKAGLRFWPAALNPKPLLEKTANRIRQKIKPIVDEGLIQIIALEDFLEELSDKNQERFPFTWLKALMQNERLTAMFLKIKNTAAQFLRWCAHFIKKLPGFLIKALLYAIKSAMQGLWRGIKSPFEKFNPVRRKKFHAMIELHNGQIIKTRAHIGVSLFFIEEKIMPLIFPDSALRHKKESSSELLQAFFDMLQIRNQPM